jgi:hypothetical protein
VASRLCVTVPCCSRCVSVSVCACDCGCGRVCGRVSCLFSCAHARVTAQTRRPPVQRQYPRRRVPWTLACSIESGEMAWEHGMCRMECVCVCVCVCLTHVPYSCRDVDGCFVCNKEVQKEDKSRCLECHQVRDSVLAQVTSPRGVMWPESCA